jgi:spore germination protein KC
MLTAVAALLAACWDKTELDELALVGMIGADIDPQSGNHMVYFQIINPLSGTTATGGTEGSQAPVYTYTVSGKSPGEIKSSIYKLLPRRMFVAHTRVMLISRRTAEDGIREIVNFQESLPDARSSIPLLVVDGSLAQVMKTFTPLERAPSDAIDYRLRLLGRQSLYVGGPFDVRDVVERMERSDMIVVPMIRVPKEGTASDSGERATNIDADQQNFIIEGGAVFREYRMVGELADDELVWYHLLNGRRGRQAQQFEMEGEPVTIEMRPVRIRRDVVPKAGRPLVRIKLDLELSTAWASGYVPASLQEMERLERTLNRVIEDKALAFCQSTRERGWDLIGLRELLRRRAPDRSDPAEAARDAEVTVEVSARLKRIGGINHP